MQWKPFTFDGKTYELTHLHPRACSYRQPEKAGNPARSYDVDVLFSLLCFTRAIEPSETPAAGILYSDNRGIRIFDFQRYEFSKRLPAIFESLAQRKCYHTGKGNFFSVDIVNENGTVSEYDIFFAASRSSKEGATEFVCAKRLCARCAARKRQAEKETIGFYVILFNVLQDKPIKVPPR